MSTRRRALVLGLVVAATPWARPSAASPPVVDHAPGAPPAPPPAAPRDTACERADPPLEEPAALGFEDAGFLEVRAACPRRGVFVRPHGAALIAVPEFYGRLGAGVLVGGRWAVHVGGGAGAAGAVELTAAMDVVAWQFVQNASIARTSLGTGMATVGAIFHDLGFERDGARFVPALRLLLPTSTAYHSARAFGVDPALVWAGRPVRSLDVYGSFGYAAWGTASLDGGGTHFWHGPTLALGFVGILFRYLQVVAQVDFLGRTSGGDFQVERVSITGALRLRVGRAFRLELAVGAPMTGTDRTDLVAGVNLSVLDR
jgi:hypothetical protein